MKEGVLYHVEKTIPEPYRGYILSRNQKIASEIASFSGVPFLGDMTDKSAKGDFYIVPARTLDFEDCRFFGINSIEDFYGTAVSDKRMVDKAILHQSCSNKPPSFYNPVFARQAQGLVLPGETAFSKTDLIKGYFRLNRDRARLKKTNESDGLGQYSVNNSDHLLAIIDQIDEGELSNNGVVLEADVQNPRTISVGYCQIGRSRFSFLAQQLNDTIITEGVPRSRYLGASVAVTKGDLPNLLSLPALSEMEKRAISVSVEFNKLYQRAFSPMASRLSFDFLYGLSEKGELVSGVTDITGRLGGTCPALMIALRNFREDPDCDYVFSRVDLDYSGSLYEDCEKREVFIDQPDLLLTASLVS